jgi:hypothetical protein
VKKAMRTYQPPTVACSVCGEPVRFTPTGPVHVKRVGILDDRWHVARVFGPAR